jgi:hypothetical protein
VKLLPSRNTGRWAVLGIAFTTAIVMAATPEEDGGPAKTAYATASFQTSSPVRAKQRPAEELHVELERLARLKARPDAEPEAGAEAGIEAGADAEAEAEVGAEGDAEMEAGNVFGATSWYVPPPPPPPPSLKPAPPPAPTAPPMPFTYLGRYEDAPTQLVILVKGERMYIVAEGDVVEDTYRIERLAPGKVELTYLPLNIKQSLGTGEAL